MRSTLLWLVLFGLLLCKDRRTGKAWLIWIPAILSYLIIHVIEALLQCHLVFHLLQYTVSSMSDILQFYILNLAIGLTLSDRLIKIRHRFVRSLVLLATFFTIGVIGIRLNIWPIGNMRHWAVGYSVFLFIFGFVHLIFKLILSGIFRKSKSMWWYPAGCLFIGFSPLVVVLTQMIQQSNATEVYNPSERMLISMAFCGAVSVPFLILGVFSVFSFINSYYRDGFIRCFIRSKPES